MSTDNFDNLVDNLHQSSRKIKSKNPIPAHLRHTRLNRNPNSNNRHLIRDPLNIPYHWYSSNDLTKLFSLARSTILRHIQLGLLSPYLVDEENSKHYTRRQDDKPIMITWLIFPATTVYTYCTTYHNIVIKTSAPPYIPPAIETAARSFVNEYLYTSGSFQPREQDLDILGNVPILPYGSRSYTLKEFRELSKLHNSKLSNHQESEAQKIEVPNQ